jgi:cellulose biosynthesis protein BcsQ
VLVVDLDHQGSTTNTLLSSNKVSTLTSTLNHLLVKGSTGADFDRAITSMAPSIPNLHLISSYRSLSPAENRITLDYLLQEPGEDIRYLLARHLICSRRREEYDIILLDSPPRLTAAAINGLCASTHVLVPTVLDKLSAEAVGTFLNSAKKLKAMLNPSLELLGVVGVITDRDVLRSREKTARNLVEEEVRMSWGGNPTILERHIPRRAAIQHAAGDAIAYLRDDDVRNLFSRLGREISGELGWRAEQRKSA